MLKASLSLLALLACFSASCWCTPVGTASPDALIDTRYGPVQGLDFGSWRRWQGVPFAEPPLPPLRFKWPQEPTVWSSPKNCTSFDIGCAQNAHSLDVPKNTSEDCLYLEITAPPKSPKLSPVVVFWYGGDWHEGGESFPLYDGQSFSEHQDTVFVAGNYRLISFGFALFPWAQANPGLADQVLLLKWVHNNIQAFGGDPDRVTIFGQSAGGESVLLHMSQPHLESASYFQSAVVESGPLFMTYKETTRGPDNAELLGRTLANDMGCAYEDEQCAQSLTTEQVLKATAKTLVIPFDFSDALQMWAPVITPPLVLQDPLRAFQKGEIVKLRSFVSGSNLNDAYLFSSALSGGNGKSLPSYTYVALVTAIFLDVKEIEAVLEIYPPSLFGDNLPQLSQLFNDYIFTCSARAAVRLATKAGIPSYHYHYVRVSPPELCFWPKHQEFCCHLCCHGAEIPYVFDDEGLHSGNQTFHFPPADATLARMMNKQWSAVPLGGPNAKNGAGDFVWPLWDPSTQLSAHLNLTSSVVSRYRGKQCDLFESFFKINDNKALF